MPVSEVRNLPWGEVGTVGQIEDGVVRFTYVGFKIPLGMSKRSGEGCT